MHHLDADVEATVGAARAGEYRLHRLDPLSGKGPRGCDDRLSKELSPNTTPLPVSSPTWGACRAPSSLVTSASERRIWSVENVNGQPLGFGGGSLHGARLAATLVAPGPRYMIIITSAPR